MAEKQSLEPIELNGRTYRIRDICWRDARTIETTAGLMAEQAARLSVPFTDPRTGEVRPPNILAAGEAAATTLRSIALRYLTKESAADAEQNAEGDLEKLGQLIVVEINDWIEKKSKPPNDSPSPAPTGNPSPASAGSPATAPPTASSSTQSQSTTTPKTPSRP